MLSTRQIKFATHLAEAAEDISTVAMSRLRKHALAFDDRRANRG